MAAPSELILSVGTVPPTPGTGESTLYFEATSTPGVRAVDSTGTQYTLGVTPQGPSTNGFRLTGVSATPIMTADSTSLSTLYLTPYLGNQISLYNGATWDTLVSAEISLAVTGRTTDLPFDIFAYNSAGVVTLEFLDWSNSTTRATALVRQDGIWSKTGSLTRRYVGTCRPRSATTFHWVRAGVDLPCKFDLFNMDNRVRQSFSLTATTNSWNYTTATWRQAQGSTNYQIDVVAGLEEEVFKSDLRVTSSNSTISIARYVGIGLDSTTALYLGTLYNKGGTANATTTNTVANQSGAQLAGLFNTPTIGRHYYSWLEYSVASGTCTWLGDNGSTNVQSGMTGSWSC